MSHYWKDLYKSHSSCTGNRRMHVYLYPNTSNQKSNCGAGTNITSPLYDVAERLETNDSISYYAIERFEAENYSYPEVDTSSRSNIASEFEDFLKNSNGTGSNLKSWRGAHVLVHGDSCSVDTAGGEYSDECDNEDGSGSYPSAFSRGTMAWTGVCNDTGLRQNSSIQETLHQFIRAYQSNVHDALGDGDSDGDIDHYDEHTLGYVDTSGNVTPMLTYHGAEFDPAGRCYGSSNSPTGYSQDLTTCTVNAVGYTADDQCDEQSYCL